MSEQRERWKESARAALAVFLLLTARICAFGLQYYQQLDDYIQYYNPFTLAELWELQQTTGLLAFRPLAVIADHTLWDKLSDQLIWAAVLICLMYAAAVVIIWNIVKRYFGSGPVFPVVMALLPLGVEGTYWMSASTRVVVGILLAALAAQSFLSWLDRGGIGRLVLYLFLQILPFGFYEQAGVLGITLTVGAAVLEWGLGRKPFPRCAVALWSVPAMGLFFLITGWLNTGNIYSGRSSLVLPVGEYYWKEFLPQILGQMWDAFGRGGFYTLAKGFVRGGRMVLSGQLVLWALVTMGLCVLLWRAVRSQDVEAGRGRLWLPLLSGLLLTLGPASVFFVLANSWFSLRGTVTSFPGLALLADALVMWLWDRLKLKREGLAVLAAALAFVFCVAGVSEIKDYRDTYENDQRIACLVRDAFKRDEVGTQAGRVGILNVEPSYLPDQNFYYHEHIHGCTESSWAFASLLVNVSETHVPSVTPLPSDPLYQSWNANSNDPLSFDLLYCYNGQSVEQVELRPGGAHSFYVCNAKGELVGYIWDEGEIGYFRLVGQMPEELETLFFTEKFS